MVRTGKQGWRIVLKPWHDYGICIFSQWYEDQTRIYFWTGGNGNATRREEKTHPITPACSPLRHVHIFSRRHASLPTPTGALAGITQSIAYRQKTWSWSWPFTSTFEFKSVFLHAFNVNLRLSSSMHDAAIIFTNSIGSFAPVDFHWDWIVFSLYQDMSYFSRGVDGLHARNFPWS